MRKKDRDRKRKEKRRKARPTKPLQNAPSGSVHVKKLRLNRHLGESFGVAEIAAAIGLPRHRLDRLFAEKLGHSVGSEISSRRIARVKLMLADPSIPIRVVASECGFCNVAYLSNVFKNATGLSPRAWRQA